VSPPRSNLTKMIGTTVWRFYTTLSDAKPKLQHELETFKAAGGNEEAYSVAGVYAQWGDKAAALRWLTEAERVHSFDLLFMKMDWTLDPIRNEPQFKAIEARLHFPP
jgi:hypothetical protein